MFVSKLEQIILYFVILNMAGLEYSETMHLYTV